MPTWKIIVVTLLYFDTARDLAVSHKYGFALMWGAYALANVGYLIATRGM